MSKKSKINNRRRRTPIIIKKVESEKKSFFVKIRDYPLVIIIGLIMLFSSFYFLIKPSIINQMNPATFKRNSIDNNVRGTFLKATTSINKDSLVFILGSSSNNKYGGVKYLANEMKRTESDSRTCIIPEKAFTNAFQNECPLLYRFDNEGKILFTANIATKEKEVVLFMDDNNISNEFILKDEGIFTFNGDDYGIELIGFDGNVLFSADFVPPNKIYIQGILYDQNRNIILSNGGIIFSGSDSIILEEKASMENTAKLFNYSGDDYLGKRIKIN
ncbi:hypothetical protein [Maribacter hydrothermalis]|uniref:Uncharacterized protein n=1 Tax=Maribacter hydrothermalis TaxID=1836467 RepID=A0A1B7ZCW4_9FLAO|nr:hypothetical protein [Maribacter hydrothermalis]APQ18666.1 hypothetical protein BTR34_15660 [Maribacter hydrothermalis]OBR40934.1 hypothetical protein A9200_13960 [Maribacter hydrothermalis]